MRTFPFAHAGVEDGGPVSRWIGWQVLAGRCLTMLPDDGVGVGLLYVTDPLGGDLAEILEFLRTRTGVTEWTGAVMPAIGTITISLCHENFRSGDVRRYKSFVT